MSKTLTHSYIYINIFSDACEKKNQLLLLLHSLINTPVPYQLLAFGPTWGKQQGRGQPGLSNVNCSFDFNADL